MPCDDCRALKAEMERLREATEALISEAQYYVKDDMGYRRDSLSKAIADPVLAQASPAEQESRLNALERFVREHAAPSEEPPWFMLCPWCKEGR